MTIAIYTLSLHDALPIWLANSPCRVPFGMPVATWSSVKRIGPGASAMWRSRRIARSTRSEEHTSELQSLTNIVCRLLLEKKNEIMAYIKESRTVLEGTLN